MSRYEEKLKDKLDDDIKLAGLGALVPEKTGETLNTQLESLAKIKLSLMLSRSLV